MVFIDFKYDLNLDTTEVDGKRHYVTPQGNVYPSVTTVISRYKEATSDGIQKWRDKVGHERADKIRDNAADFGTAIHSMAEAYIKDEPLPEADFFQKDRWAGLKRVIDRNFGAVYACETCLYSDVLKIAGRTDVIGEFNGVPSLIDFKNSNKPKLLKYVDTWFLQGSAYSYMWAERTKDPATTPRQLVFINTVPHDDPQVFIEPVGRWIPKLKDVVKQYA